MDCYGFEGIIFLGKRGEHSAEYFWQVNRRQNVVQNPEVENKASGKLETGIELR